MGKIDYKEKQTVLGKETSYLGFKADMKTIETYYNSSHDKRELRQDGDGNLWLYDFHEEMNFSGGFDYIYEHFFKVESAEQAAQYKGTNILTIEMELRPYVFVGPQSAELKVIE